MSVCGARTSERKRECLRKVALKEEGGVEAIERLAVCPLNYKESRGLRNRRNVRG